MNDGYSGDQSGVGVGTVLLMLGLFAGFAFTLYWIYYDAKEHQVSVLNKPYDSDAPAIWVFVCFICFVLGVPYYLYRRTTVLALQTVPVHSPDSTETELKTVADLKAKGLITEAEAEQKRRKILGL